MYDSMMPRGIGFLGEVPESLQNLQQKLGLLSNNEKALLVQLRISPLENIRRTGGHRKNAHLLRGRFIEECIYLEAMQIEREHILYTTYFHVSRT
jgi:hypothetical protein